jgi:hypothetical protein
MPHPQGGMICGLPAADQQRCFPASACHWIPFRCSSHPVYSRLALAEAQATYDQVIDGFPV